MRSTFTLVLFAWLVFSGPAALIAAPPAYTVENRCAPQFVVVNRTGAVAAAPVQTVCGPNGRRLVSGQSEFVTEGVYSSTGDLCAAGSCGSTATGGRTRFHLFGRPHRR
jgi:hypothetical protein